MTLKEKFIKCRNKTDEYYILPIIDDAEQLMKIAEEFAIGFSEWRVNDWVHDERWTKISDMKELLKIYKKEKL